MIDDPWFLALAVPAVLIVGISKGGFGGGLGGVSVPLMALAVPPTLAVAVLAPILCVMDLLSIAAWRGQWDRAILRILVPAAVAGTLLGAATFRLFDDDQIRLIIGLIASGFGLNYWFALILAPVMVGIFGMVLERTLLKWLTGLDHLYGLLLTFGIALIIQGLFQNYFGSSGLPYAIPDQLRGGVNLGFMFLPIYRGWVVVFSLVICLITWYLIERTQFGAYLRAATENPALVRAFGINVPRMITLTYGLGVGLAALAGVLSAPINQVRPLMGADLIIVVFAVVVIGGMGSIMGSIITGFALGIIEGLTKYFYPEASNTVVFVLMVLILLVKPTGLTGRAT